MALSRRFGPLGFFLVAAAIAFPAYLTASAHCTDARQALWA